ncbi:hypothetical protein ING2E5B_1303 [Fermentimonas caenicola]|uniref:Uncharacterized protein n=1 Tax=Fermentimonas caenicola TaxID=1562970 RepID=A0A098C0W9_9BACT|nr:hypothetical protein ING2E5B_1303 [Fermentimonas caenicola]
MDREYKFLIALVPNKVSIFDKTTKCFKMNIMKHNIPFIS